MNFFKPVANFFGSVWRLKWGKALLLACAGLIVAGTAVGLILYNAGSVAELKARELLTSYEASGQTQVNGQQAVPSGGAALTTPVMVGGYYVLGVLEISSIGEKLPVISQTDDNALNVSVCYYEGAYPGEKGNIVITGHNYANGAMFGKLDRMKPGDIVTLTAKGNTYTYKVYAIKTIAPDDTSALEKYEGDYALTLLTCTDLGNMRLLVQCKLSDGTLA